MTRVCLRVSRVCVWMNRVPYENVPGGVCERVPVMSYIRNGHYALLRLHLPVCKRTSFPCVCCYENALFTCVCHYEVGKWSSNSICIS